MPQRDLGGMAMHRVCTRLRACWWRASFGKSPPTQPKVIHLDGRASELTAQLAAQLAAKFQRPEKTPCQLLAVKRNVFVILFERRKRTRCAPSSRCRLKKQREQARKCVKRREAKVRSLCGIFLSLVQVSCPPGGGKTGTCPARVQTRFDLQKLFPGRPREKPMPRKNTYLDRTRIPKVRPLAH